MILIEALLLFNVQFWKSFIGEIGSRRNAKNFLLAGSGEARNVFVKGVFLIYHT